MPTRGDGGWYWFLVWWQWGLGILIAPLVSTLSGLIVSRTVFSIGRTAVAACFLIVVADYVQENSRGKWNAFQCVTFGIGSIVAAIVIVPATEMVA